MKILVTGSKGFIGKNLCSRLSLMDNFSIATFDRCDPSSALPSLISDVDYIVHLAGENRPLTEKALSFSNIQLTSEICSAIKSTGRKIPVFFSSSIHASSESAYGKSKLIAENFIKDLWLELNNPSIICRLPGVFGKWSKPNYNSVVATFCYQIANDLPITTSNETIKLLYIDDVVDSIISSIYLQPKKLEYLKIQPEYDIYVPEIAKKIYEFKSNRKNLNIGKVGKSFSRALYATYISYLPEHDFSYSIPIHRDNRGDFLEVLKTEDSGQFSVITIRPGATRGGHYHHSKIEKFVVLRGQVKFRFRNIIDNRVHEIIASFDKPLVIETIPGWSHDITNTGNEDAICLLWANEIYDPKNPDTYHYKIDQ